MVKPRLITKVENPDTGVVTTTDVEEVRQVISPETAARVRSMMQSVVTDGGGQSGAVKGYSIGGKTGTSEPNPNHPEDGYVASFLAIAPVENTKVVALMSLYGPQGRSHFGGEISAPVVSQVLSEVLPYLGIPSNDTSSESTGIKIPDLRNKTVDEAKQLLKDLGITCLTSASSSEIVTSQTPKAGTSISPKGVVRRSRGSSLCGLMMLRSASLKSIVSILSLLQMVNLVMIQIWPHLWYNGLWRKEYYLFLQWI